MIALEIIVRIAVVLLVSYVIAFGILVTYLNVFLPWRNKNKPKDWDIHKR